MKYDRCSSNTYLINYSYMYTGTLTIGTGVITIGDNAFYYCTGITGSLVIPNSVTSIPNNAFSSCSGFDGKFVSVLYSASSIHRPLM